MLYRSALLAFLFSLSPLAACDVCDLQDACEDCSWTDDECDGDIFFFEEDTDDDWVYTPDNDLPDGWEEDTFLEDGFEDFVFSDDEEARALHQDDSPIPDLPLVEAIPDLMAAGCVNALSGDLIETVSDLTVPGPLPLALQRSWSGGERKWRFSHMPKLELGFSKGGNHVEAGYRDDLGSGYHFKGPVKFAAENLSNPRKGLRISPRSFKKGLTNIGSSEISGQTSWKNASIRAVHN